MMKRLLMILLAMLLLCGMAAAEELSYCSDFSEGTDGWYPRSGGGAVLEVTDEGLLITGRTATWNSPGRAFELVPGEPYRLSVEVKQDEIAEGRFILSAERSAGGEVSYENIVSAQVPKGQWTALEAVWVAGDYDSFVLYVEGGEAETSFTIRNFTLKGAAVKEEAPAPQQPFAMPADAGELTALFDGMEWKTSYKKDGQNNPLYTQRFGADPGFLVWGDRLYVYTTNDVIEYNADGSVKENGYGLVNKINCISSTDLVNWTDHGAIPVAGSKGILTWAKNSWAPCAAHKVIDGKDQFFLYSCNNGNGVTVLVADDPAGPFRDPLGKGLITRQTPNCANVTWLFDPAVFVDEDGTGYLYFGGGIPGSKHADPGTGRCVQLGEDMISIVGEPRTMDIPYLFEDSGMIKIGDTYYYSYCSNWNTTGNPYGMGSGAIQYMTSKDPLGPFEYAGQAFVNQGTFFGLWGNNHHSMVEFGGVHYLLYHNRPVEQAMGITGNYRSPQIDVMTVNEDGSIKPVVGTMKGVEQLHNFDPYTKVAAQTMYREAGIEVSGYGPDAVTLCDGGDWMQLKNVDFANGCSRFTLCAGSAGGGAVRITTGGIDGEVLCEMTIEAGEMKEYTAQCSAEAGVCDLYLLFAGDVQMKWWQAE
ncbi:MAG: family 43 glycosylhydrolase [Clostridia bacterium]|nr:family 43 glycosylhydrolase [Clostridia bacterium]